MTSFIVLYVITTSYKVLITPFSIEVSLNTPFFLMPMHAFYLVFFGISVLNYDGEKSVLSLLALKIMFNKCHTVLCLSLFNEAF